MNLDDLVQSIPDSEADLRSQLSHWVNEWKKSDESLEELVYLIGKWHGNVWFQEAEVSNTFHRNWVNFRANAIEGIGGMTVNERLYTFGLFALWDASDETSKSKLRAKIKAYA